jgi:outer membrane protein assembly factor BamA
MNYYGTRLTSTFLERRFEIYGAYYQGSSVLKNIRDKDGNLIVQAENPPVARGHTTIVGTRMDLTDDYQDPRQGFRIDVARTQTPPVDSGPDFYVMDYNTTAYVPIGRRSTWAFNYLRSDAHVTRKGETDPAVIEQQQGLNCGAIVNPVQRQFCIDVVNSMAANNTYGTASALGGFSRLRSYPTGRFKGAHTVFYGSELRWNLTDEATPFDIFVMKDIRTSWQVSLFYEVGSTADVRSQVGDVLRSSYGMGLRMVTASGVVFRADLAAGREGVEPNIFIGYPWEF